MAIPIRRLTDEMTRAMHEDFDALGILRPTHEPRATEYVPQMLHMIGALERNGGNLRKALADFSKTS